MARDFREKFGLSYLEIGLGVSYLEAWHLVQSLRKDPSSWLHAAMAGWDHPASREWTVLAQILDVTYSSKVKRTLFKPWPRPWPDTKSKIGGKKTVKRSITDVLAILRPNSTE